MVEDESHDHLFWECQYAKKIWDTVCLKCNIDCRQLNQFDSWISAPIRGKFRQKVIQATCVAVLYHIWRMRNLAIWEGKLIKPEQVAMSVLKETYMRVVAVMPKKVSRIDKDWFYILYRCY